MLLKSVSLSHIDFHLDVSFREAQTSLHVFIHHIADADSRDDFHKVGQNATVEAKKAFFSQNPLGQLSHGQGL